MKKSVVYFYGIGALDMTSPALDYNYDYRFDEYSGYLSINNDPYVKVNPGFPTSLESLGLNMSTFDYNEDLHASMYYTIPGGRSEIYSWTQEGGTYETESPY